MIAALDGAFIYINYRSENTALHQSLQQISEHVKGAFELALESTETKMLQIATFVSASPEVQQVFLRGMKAVAAEGGGPGGVQAKKAREELLSRVGPGRQKLSQEFDFRQLHFHLGPGSTSFLRAHRPEKFGDNMDTIRHTIVAANRDKEPVTGFESGRVYSGIRGVVPVFADDPDTGKHIHVGALEAGTSFQMTLAEVARTQHVNLAVLLTEKHLRSVMFPDFQHRFFEKHQPHNGFVIEAATDSKVRTIIERGDVVNLWKKPGFVLTHIDDIPISICGFYLRDFLGKKETDRLPVGLVVVWFDPREEVAQFEQALKFNLLYALVGFFIVEVLLYYGIRLTSGRLEKMVQKGREELQQSNIKLTQEVEERRQAQLALSKERRLFVTGPTVVWRWESSDQWPVVYVSPNVEELFGYAPIDLLTGRIKFAEIIHPDDLIRVSGEVRSYCEKGIPSFDQEYRLIDSRGETRWIFDQTVVEKNEDGVITHFHGYIQDISQRKESEDMLRRYRDQLREMILERTAKLQKSEARFRALLDHSPDIIVELDTHLDMLYSNRAANELMPDAANKKCFESFACRKTVCNNCPVIKAMESGQVQIATIETVQPEEHPEKRFWEVTGVPLTNDDGTLTGALKVARDVTGRIESESKIQTALDEKEILLREIHHRVKNNMQVIRSLLKLNARFIDNEQALLAFAESRNRIKAMALIHETLYQADNMANIDLHEYVGKLVRNLVRAYNIHQGRVQVRVDLGELVLDLEDATPLGLILNELLSNAFKYAFPDGREGEITLSLHEKEEGTIDLVVRDNGIGMPENLDIHSVRDSMGVQLVLGLVEGQLGGSIDVFSDGGTTVHIRFAKKHIE